MTTDMTTLIVNTRHMQCLLNQEHLSGTIGVTTHLMVDIALMMSSSPFKPNSLLRSKKAHHNQETRRGYRFQFKLS